MVNLKKIIICISIMCLILGSYVYATEEQYVWSEDVTETSSTQTEKIEENQNNLNLESGGAILIEQNTGKVLYTYNEHQQLRPASVTKVMTILLIMEALDSGQLSLTDKIPCSENASSMGGSQIWLDTKETLTVDEMLKAICVVSANDYNVQFRHDQNTTKNLIS